MKHRFKGSGLGGLGLRVFKVEAFGVWELGLRALGFEGLRPLMLRSSGCFGVWSCGELRV